MASESAIRSCPQPCPHQNLGKCESGIVTRTGHFRAPVCTGLADREHKNSVPVRRSGRGLIGIDKQTINAFFPPQKAWIRNRSSIYKKVTQLCVIDRERRRRKKKKCVTNGRNFTHLSPQGKEREKEKATLRRKQEMEGGRRGIRISVAAGLWKCDHVPYTVLFLGKVQGKHVHNVKGVIFSAESIRFIAHQSPK